jgi:hypothetical protein
LDRDEPVGLGEADRELAGARAEQRKPPCSRPARRAIVSTLTTLERPRRKRVERVDGREIDLRTTRDPVPPVVAGPNHVAALTTPEYVDAGPAINAVVARAPRDDVR